MTRTSANPERQDNREFASGEKMAGAGRLAMRLLLKACARLLLLAPLMLCMPSKSFAQPAFYIQRGVGPAEAFGAMFDLGPGYGRQAGSFQSVQQGGAPGFKMGGTNGLQPGSDSWYSAQRDMQHYAQGGDACQTYLQMNPTKVVPRANDIIDAYSQPGRGYVITYPPNAALPSGAYVGNLNSSEIAIIDPKAKAWGISPALISVGDDGTLQYREGDRSVFGPANPLYKTCVQQPVFEFSKSQSLVTRVLSWIPRPNDMSRADPGQFITGITGTLVGGSLVLDGVKKAAKDPITGGVTTAAGTWTGLGGISLGLYSWGYTAAGYATATVAAPAAVAAGTVTAAGGGAYQVYSQSPGNGYAPQDGYDSSSYFRNLRQLYIDPFSY